MCQCRRHAFHQNTKKTAFPYSLSQASVLNYRTGGFWSNAVSVFEKRRVKNCQSFQEQMMASLQDQFFQHCLFIVDKVFASTSEPQLQPPLSSKISKDSSKGGIFFLLFIYFYLFIYLLQLVMCIAQYWMHCYQNQLNILNIFQQAMTFHNSLDLIQIQLFYEHKLNSLQKCVSEKKKA